MLKREAGIQPDDVYIIATGRTTIMRAYNFKKGLLGVAAIASLGFGIASHAATVISLGGANFSVNAVGSGTTFAFTYTADFSGIDSTSGWWNGYAAGVSLDFGNGQISSASLQNPASTAGGVWSFFIDKLNDNGCSGNVANDAICAYETGKSVAPLALTQLNGQTLQWYFDVTFSSTAAATAFFASEHNLKFMATNGTLDNKGEWEKQYSLISQDITITCCRRPPDKVPEPGTLALLGLGLLGLGMSRRKG